MPGTAVNRAAASTGSMPTVCSSFAAYCMARQIVRERWGPTPARCHSHDGMRRQVSADGGTRMPSGAGPGAASPNRLTSVRNEAWASLPVTFCSSTAGTSASTTRPVRGTRSPGCRAAESTSRGWRGRKPSAASRAPSRSGSPAMTSAAPCPHACACTSCREVWEIR